MTSTTSPAVCRLHRRSRATAWLRLLAVAAALAAAPGCAHRRDYLWVDEIAPSTATSGSAYQIAAGDVLGVRVWNQESMSIERARVREDGKISLPFLNDVEVAGMEPGELGRRLEVKLKTFIVNPVVTVLVQERVAIRVSVLGEVARPGAYEVEKGSGVLQALAAAGGLGPFAHDSGIYVLRSGYWADGNPSPARIRFRYSDLRHGKVPASSFHLQRGDVVVAE